MTPENNLAHRGLILALVGFTLWASTTTLVFPSWFPFLGGVLFLAGLVSIVEGLWKGEGIGRERLIITVNIVGLYSVGGGIWLWAEAEHLHLSPWVGRSVFLGGLVSVFVGTVLGMRNRSTR